jgi:tetratricopeptide (TPR) repeat protein
MSIALFLAAASAAAVEPPAMIVEGDPAKVDVAFVQLMQGRNEEAIARIRANRALEADDPAALINLGTAHARLGQRDRAMDYYRAAIASRTPLDLELADGTWLDSRRAARMAVTALNRGGTLALRLK